jgi:hypothetical protein
MDVQRCAKCGKMVEGWTLWFGRCEACSEEKRALVKKSTDVEPALWGHSADEVISGLLSDRKDLASATKQRQSLESGYATFVRDDGDETFLVVLQMWVEQRAVLVLRFGGDLHLLRFKDIPTTKYKEIAYNVRRQYHLLSNGPLILTDRSELGPSVAEIFKVICRHWSEVTNARAWSQGKFRKQDVLTLALTLEASLAGGIKAYIGQTLKFLEDLREKPDGL